MGILLLVVALLGVFTMIKFSALIGGIIYIIAFWLSLNTLKSKVNYDDQFSIVKSLKDINKDNFSTHGLCAIVVASLPIVIIIGLYSWIVLDSIRSVNFYYNIFK